ncbi:MAG: RNA polymerase sigma factor [Exilibacterium sp.]
MHLKAEKETTVLSGDSSIDLSELFLRYRSEISSVIYKQLGSRDDAADLTQDTFLRYSVASRGRFIENPRGFLLQTARNLVIDFIRRSATIAKVIDKGKSETDALDVSPSTEQQIIDVYELNKFKQTLDRLPPRCQQVFILRKIDGYSYAEISEKLNISHSAIEKHIMRALKTCREQLGRG